MDAAGQARKKPTGTGFTIGVTYFGCAGILLGLLMGLNWAFDLGIAYRHHVFPGDWKLSLLGIVGGAGFAGLGHFLETRAYQRLVAKHPSFPVLLWTVLPLSCLVAIAWAGGMV
jgi:hypothetical protein